MPFYNCPQMWVLASDTKPVDFRQYASASAVHNMNLSLFAWLYETVRVILPISHRGFAYTGNHTCIDGSNWRTYWRINGLADRAVEANRIDFVKYILERDICPQYAYRRAAKAGNTRMLDVLASACRTDCECDVLGSGVVHSAAEFGQIGVLEWALERGIVPDRTALRVAASCAKLHALQWMLEVGCAPPIDIARALLRLSSDKPDATQGVIRVLQYLADHLPRYAQSEDMCEYIAQFAKDRRILDWWRDRYGTGYDTMFHRAVKYENVDVVQYLWDNHLYYMPKSRELSMCTCTRRMREWLQTHIAN
jgi:hypothetical protein